ncbi:MAG: antibiotic biosynthesis monooxygenase family protein [Chloroflexota bacterium]
MIVVANRIYVNPDHAAAFEEAFSKRAALVDGMPGFVAFQLLRPTGDDQPYTVMTFWETMDAFHAWTQSESFKQGHARSGSLPADTFTRPTELEISEVITSTARIERA